MFVALLLAPALLALSGCGSLLSSMNMGTIEDKPDERTMAQVLEDNNIETKLTVNLPAENEAFQNSHLIVVSYNGYVLLAGQVNDAILKDTATTVARKVKGVRRIYNELEISPPTSALTRTNDAYLTTKLKSSLLTNSDIAGTHIKVVTENSVVYLMGLASAQEAEQVSRIASKVSGVHRVVPLFEQIK
jgi:osmotically-inducible protein OsmY